jgi:acyl dehydratase
MGKERHGTSGWRKLGVALKNSFSRGLDEALVGTEVVGPLFVVHQGEALAYALSTDDSNPVYFEKEGALVSPLYASRILKDVLEMLILHPKLGMNLLKMVHAEQTLNFHEPLRAGMELVPAARIEAIRDVSSGQIAEMSVALRQGDEVVVDGVATMFVRQPKKKGAGKGQGKQGPESVPTWEELTTFELAPDQPKRYALASQDYNPIHTKKWVAKLAGFPRPVAHGLCVMAMTTARLINEFGNKDPARLSSIKVRFSKPAFTSQDLTLKVAGEGNTRQFMLENPKGKPVLSNGVVVFR